MSFALVEPVIQKATDELDQVAQKGCAVYDFATSLWEEGSLHLADLTLSEARELYLRNFLRKYIQSVKHNINERFLNAVPLLPAFAIFDPRKIRERSSLDFLSMVANKSNNLQSTTFSVKDQQHLKDEWRVFKYELMPWQNEIPQEIQQPSHSKVSLVITPTDWCLQRLLTMNNLSLRNLPLLATVAESIVAIPVSNAWPERGASALKLIKSRLRSTIKNDLLSALMQIHVNGPEVGTKKFGNLITAAITKWQSKARRKVKYARKIVEQANLAESSHSTGQETQIVPLRDAEIQTDDVEAEPVFEEVEWVSKQLDLPGVDSDPDSDYGSDTDSNFE